MLFASGKRSPRYRCLLSTSARHLSMTCSDLSSSFPQNLQRGSFSSPIVCLCFRKVPWPVIIPTTAFAFLLLIASIWSAHPSISEFLKVLAVRSTSLSVFPLFRMFLGDPAANLCLITVSYIPVAGSGPVKISFLACLASRPLFYFLLFLYGPAARKVLVDNFLPADSGSDSRRTLTSRWLCTLQGLQYRSYCMCRYVHWKTFRVRPNLHTE